MWFSYTFLDVIRNVILWVDFSAIAYRIKNKTKMHQKIMRTTDGSSSREMLKLVSFYLRGCDLFNEGSWEQAMHNPNLYWSR